MRASTVPASILIGATAFLLYAATLSRHPSADSLFFALAIESDDPQRLLNQRHPLLHPVGWAFVELWRMLGWRGRALLPLQMLNAIGGATAVALLVHIAARLTGSARIGGAVAAGFAVSGAMWLLSTEAEFVTVPLAVSLMVLDVALLSERPRWDRPAFLLGLGLAIGVATLLYLSNASLLLVAIAAAYPGSRSRVWLRRATLLVVGALAPLLTAVALLSLLGAAPTQWPAALGHLAARHGYGQLSWSDLPHGAYAFARSLMLYPGLGMNDSTRAYLAAATPPQRAGFAVYCALVAALALAAPIWALRRRQELWHGHGRIVVLLAVWALPHALFAIWWVSGDVSFWVPLLATWWLLIALLVANTSIQRNALAAVATIAAALLLINGVAFILPRHDLAQNRRHWIATSVADRTATADVVVTPDKDLLVLYLQYFARRAVVAADARDPSQAIVAALAQARASGGRVFAVGLGRLAPEARFTVARAWDADGEVVWEVRER